MIKAVLFDISGVLYIDGQAVTGAVEVVNRLQTERVPIRFVTNSSRDTQLTIFQKLTAMGFNIEPTQVFSAPVAVRNTLRSRQLTPYCLVHPNLESEFSMFKGRDYDAVFVADAAEQFTYENLNKAFELLTQGAPLFAVGRNKYFKSSGKLCLDAGPFINALEYASAVKAEVIGKPAAKFFLAAVDDMGVKPEDVLMVGDDVEADVFAAADIGINACLVKTGKYKQGDEALLASEKTFCKSSVVEAILELIAC
jgi:HAD superfamily hydrolase (TIGR01458 family)